MKFVNSLWDNIIKDKNYLKSIELNEENVCAFRELFDNYAHVSIENYGKVTEECFVSIPEDWKKEFRYVDFNSDSLKLFGAWIVKYYQNSPEIICAAIDAFGKREVEQYISKETPCIFEVVKNRLHWAQDLELLKYLNDEQIEEVKDYVLKAVEADIKRTIVPGDGLDLFHKWGILYQFVNNIPKTISNYNEIATLVGSSCGLALTSKYLPESVVNEVYESTTDFGRRFYKEHEGFDLLAAQEDYKKSTPEDKRDLFANERFLREQYRNYGSELANSI